MVEIDGLELLKYGGRSSQMGLLFLLLLSLVLFSRESEIGVDFMGLVEMGGGFLGSIGVEVDGLESLQHGRRSSELSLVMSLSVFSGVMVGLLRGT